MHERYPAPSEMLATTRPSRQIHNDWSVAKSHEECQPFTFSLDTGSLPPKGAELQPNGDGRYVFEDGRFGYCRLPDTKAQEQFLKKLATLEKKIARERKAREKKLAA